MAKTVLKVLCVAALVVGGSQLVAFAPYAGDEGSACMEVFASDGSETAAYSEGMRWLPLGAECIASEAGRTSVEFIEATPAEQLAVLALFALLAVAALRGGAVGEALGYAGLALAFGAALLFLGGISAGGFVSLFLVPGAAAGLAAARRRGLRPLVAVAVATLAWFVWVVGLFMGLDVEAAWISAVVVLAVVALAGRVAPGVMALGGSAAV